MANPSPFEPIAEMLISAYFDTAAFSQRFRTQHDMPPNTITKTHHLRSVLQSRLIHTVGFDLDEFYQEFGRVEFQHHALERRYLLRSSAALKWDAKKFENAMFDAGEFVTSDVMILVTGFGPSELHLSEVGAIQKQGTRQLISRGHPAPLGIWPYEPLTAPPFDQGNNVNPFEELGDIDLGEAEGE